MAKPRRRKRSRMAEDRDLAERLLNEFRAAVDKHTMEMEEPLCHATQFARVLELAQHAPDDEFQSIGLLAAEMCSRLETVHDLWRAIREDAVLEPPSRSRAKTDAA